MKAPRASFDIGEWLRRRGFSRYEPAFRDNAIDFDVLPTLTDEDLKELGVGALGHRREILNAIVDLTGGAAQSSRILGVAGAERRQLTVLFCDLVGSTTLAARLDPEDMRGLIADYRQCCVETIGERGHVAEFMGDGVLVYFGYPEAKERDPELAVEAALAIARAVPNLKTPAEAPLHVRVGIATGLVVVGRLARSGESEEFGVVGATPHIAARLQAIAEPGSVVICDATRRLLGFLYDVADLGALDLKGLSDPTRAWRVLGPGAVESRFEALRGEKLTAFVGRRDETELLLRCWEKAKAGVGQVVLLVGEAGIGKSRLVAEFLKRVESEKQLRLRYYCSPQYHATAFHPVIQQMAQAAGLARDDAPSVKLNKLDAFLARSGMSPEDSALFADLLSLPNDGRYPAASLSARDRRERLMKALAGLLDTLPQDRPALMALEDAHWADPTTLEAFGRIADRIGNLRALLLVTFRSESESLQLGAVRATALWIPRLDSSEIGLMVNDVVGKGMLPARIREEIVERAEGVPLFAEEMTKAVLEGCGEGDPAAQSFTVPPSLQATLMERLDRLGPAKEAAQIASAIGREIPLPLLRAVAGEEAFDLDVALNRLVRSGLLLKAGFGADAAFRFSHALLQDLAYGALLRDRRRSLHVRIAEVLEASFPEIGETQPEVLARHCAEAGWTEKAVALWGKAGRLSLKRSALLEAESSFTRALAEIEATSITPILRRVRIACQIGLASTLLLRRGYTSAEARTALSRTLALIEQANALGDPVQDPLALFTTLHGLWVSSIVVSSGEATRQFAAECLSLAEKAGAKGELIAAHRAVGQTLLFSGDFVESRSHFDIAVELYNPTDNRQKTRYGGDHWSTALSARSAALWALGYPNAALADARQGLLFAQSLGHALTLGNNLIFAAWTNFCCGRYAAAKAHADETVALAEQSGQPFYEAFGFLLQALVSAAEGASEDAIQRLSSALAAYRSTGASLLTASVLAHLAKAHASLGQVQGARRGIEDALATLEATTERWCESDILRVAGEIEAESMDRDLARTEAFFDRALAVARRQQAKSWELRAATSKARLWRDQGRRAEAHALLAPVYAWFAEGFETLDLKRATTLIEEIAG